MRPYKVEHLMDNPEQSPEDVFELVGILVHSGTAESGHYYSYIRERPSKSEKENWVEFNDDTVTPWDIKSMESSCFGGIDYRSPMDNSNMHFDKTWSAYMLFYQRSSVLATQKQALEQSEMSSPVRLPIVPRLSNHIALENELVMRKYCLYDPSHGAFVLKMLVNIKQINKGRCSESHNLEKLALVMALNHLDQVVTRTKDLPDFPSFMMSLKQICQSCAECSVDFLEWFCQRPEALRNTLLRNPDMLVRSEMATFIINSLLKVKADANYAYGLTDEEDSVDALDTNDDPRVLQDVVATISKLLDIFHNNTRAWPEFFGVLSNIAGLGDQEAALLVDKGYLQKSLEIICADPMLRITNQLQRMLNIISKRIATRPVSFDSIIGLLDRLLDVCDLDVRPIAAGQERFVRERLDSSSSDERVRITQDENHLLLQHWTSNQAHILTEKLLQIHQNYHATHAIIKKLLQSSRSPDSCIYNAISHGIRRGSSAAPSGPFLRAAIVYCEYSQEAKAIPSMVSCVAKMANHIDAAEGKELLQFFLDVIELKTDHNKEDLIKLCLDNIALWAPVLLNNYDIVVRENTEAFLVDILLQYGCPPSFGTSPEDVEKANEMVVVGQKLGIACLEYLNDTYIKARQQAVRVSLDSILNIIANCRSYFEEDADDGITRHFNEMHSCRSLARFRTITGLIFLQLSYLASKSSPLKKLTKRYPVCLMLDSEIDRH
jgi:ubiquitin carboxyl-terminal hydrolase 34